MPILVACLGCGTQLRVRDDFLGKAIKCPHCGQVLRPELPAEAAEAISAVPLDPPPAPLEDDATEEDRPKRRRRRRDNDDDDDEDRPRRRKGGYAPCPSCGSKHAERVLWTFWGSFYGPALFTHVRCKNCGTAYNGRNGRSNLIPAIIFFTVPLLLILGILAFVGLLIWSRVSPRRADIRPTTALYVEYVAPAALTKLTTPCAPTPEPSPLNPNG